MELKDITEELLIDLNKKCSEIGVIINPNLYNALDFNEIIITIENNNLCIKVDYSYYNRGEMNYEYFYVDFDDLKLSKEQLQNKYNAIKEEEAKKVREKELEEKAKQALELVRKENLKKTNDYKKYLELLEIFKDIK